MMAEKRNFMMFEAFDFDSNADFLKGWNAIKLVVEKTQLEKELLRAKAFFYSKRIHPLNFEHYLSWREQRSKGSHSETSKNFPNQTGDLTGQPVGDPEAGGDENSFQDVETGSDKQQLYLQNNPTVGEISTLPSKDDSSVEAVLESIISDRAAGKSCDDTPRTEALEEEVSILHSNKEEVIHSEGDISGMTNLTSFLDEMHLKDCVAGASERHEEERKELTLGDVAYYIQNNLPIPGVITVDVKPTNLNPTPSVLSRKLKPWEGQGTNEDDGNKIFLDTYESRSIT